MSRLTDEFAIGEISRLFYFSKMSGIAVEREVGIRMMLEGQVRTLIPRLDLLPCAHQLSPYIQRRADVGKFQSIHST